MLCSFSSQEFTSPFNLSCSFVNILVFFIHYIFFQTYCVQNGFVHSNHRGIPFISSVCSNMNSFSLVIFSFICGPGFNSSPPAINITAVIIPKQPCVCTSHYIYIMVVHQQLAFLRSKKLILALYSPIYTPISH